MAREKITVKQDEQNPITREVLAESIVKISEGFDRLSKSGLNQNAIEVLIQNSSGICRRDIRLVLDALRTLAKNYTTPTK